MANSRDEEREREIRVLEARLRVLTAVSLRPSLGDVVTELAGAELAAWEWLTDAGHIRVRAATDSREYAELTPSGEEYFDSVIGALEAPYGGS